MKKSKRIKLLSVIFVICIIFSTTVVANSGTVYGQNISTRYEMAEVSPDTTEATQGDTTEEAEPTTTNPTETTPTQPVTPTPVIKYKGSAGSNLNYFFNRAKGVLTFSGKGTYMNNYSLKNPAPWSSFAKEIKVIDMTKAKSLKKIGNYAFYQMNKLYSFTYPETVVSIGKYSFAYTTKLKSMLVSKKVKTIKEKAFFNSGIKSIKFLGKKTEIFKSKNTIPSEAEIKCFDKGIPVYKYAKKYNRKCSVLIEKISIDTQKCVLCAGKKGNVSATITPDKASNKKIKWFSTDKSIASVSKEGVVKAKKKGICYIYAKSTDGSNTESLNKCKVIVTGFMLYEYMFTKNNCYKEHLAIDPKGIIVHSTGVNNPYVSAFVPNWNVPKPGGREVCVHAFLGKGSGGKLVTYQVLPFEMACWGCGKGSKGSFNYYPGYIQFECCEDSTYNYSYFKKVYDEATDFCAYLCLRYGLSYKQVTSHREACLNGYASAHGDIDHWLAHFGLKISDLRNTVKRKIYEIDPTPDLVSGSKNKKLTIKSDTFLMSKQYFDDYGTGSKKLKTLKKGSVVTFYEDCDGGWSRVKYEGKKGYVCNSCFDLDYKSQPFKERISQNNVPYYTVPSTNTKYRAGFLKYYTKVSVISYITAGTKKGWSQIKYNGKEYYVRTQYFM